MPFVMLVVKDPEHLSCLVLVPLLLLPILLGLLTRSLVSSPMLGIMDGQGHLAAKCNHTQAHQILLVRAFRT